AVLFTNQHAWTRYGHFIAFTTHVLDQNGQVQLTATAHFKHGIVVGFVHTQSHVGLQFAVQTIAQLTAGHELAFTAGQRRGVHHEIHGQGRLVNAQQRQRFLVSRIGYRATNAQLFNTVDQHDVAGFGFIYRHTLQTLELQNLVDAALDSFAIRTKFHDHVLGRAHATTVHTAYTDLAHVGAVVQGTDLQLQRCVDVIFTLRNVFQNRVEQRTHIAFTHVFGQTGVARQTRCVNDGEVQLFVGRAQFVEQVERGVDREVRTGAGTVNLVDHHNRTQTQFQSFTS